MTVDLRKAPITRVLFPFITGLLAAEVGGPVITVPFLLLICAGLWLLLLVLYLGGSRQSASISRCFAPLAFLLIAATGYGTGLAAAPVDPGLPVDEQVIVEGVVTGAPAPGNRSWVLELRTGRVCAAHHAFRVRTVLKTYMEMPSDSLLPSEGERWRMYGSLLPVRNSGNPGDPDYERIMQRQGIWYRFFADSADNRSTRVEEPSRISFPAAGIRNMVSGQWRGDPEAVSLLKAVCLGDRSGITDDQQQSYTDAGGMHLLAVSGLHVGLIWWFLRIALAWMVRLFRSELYRSVTILCLLWFYAYVAGFSSSVSRSVTMFSLFTISGSLGRRTGTVNTILVSAFFLILIRPSGIMDVGFQLSYAAVLGIVSIVPRITIMFKIRNRILKRIWEATVVSLAAQASTAPLVAYYFHQLPAYAVITNLLAIPMLSGLISLFLVSIPFMATGLGEGLFNRILTGLAALMNRSMEMVASIPGSKVTGLYPDRVSVVLLMLLLFAGVIVLNERRALFRYAVLGILSFLLCWTSWSRYRLLATGEMAISHLAGCSVVTFREGLQVEHHISWRDSISRQRVETVIMGPWASRRYQCSSFVLNDTHQVTGNISAALPADRGLVLLGNESCRGWILPGGSGATPPFPPGEVAADFILLSMEPEVPYPDRLRISCGCPVIADGSNRSWYIRKTRDEMAELYETGVQGAYFKRW